MEMIKVGEIAPDFKLLDTEENEITLKGLKGKRVLLSFHPLAWTPVCIDQMRSLEREYDKIKAKGVDVVLGVSVDPVPSKGVWGKSLGIENVILVADFEPKGEASKAFGLYEEKMGTAKRANVLLDKDGKVEWTKLYKIPELPDIEEVLENL